MDGINECQLMCTFVPLCDRNLRSLQVELPGHGYSMVPLELGSMTNLQSLCVKNILRDNSDLVTLPRLRQLTRLEMRVADLKEFPEEISKLSLLRTIRLGSTECHINLSDCFENLAACTALQHIELEDWINADGVGLPDSVSALTWWVS